jgi:hypothetical protein
MLSFAAIGAQRLYAAPVHLVCTTRGYRQHLTWTGTHSTTKLMVKAVRRVWRVRRLEAGRLPGFTYTNTSTAIAHTQ